MEIHQEEGSLCPPKINHPTTGVPMVHGGVLAEVIHSEIKELRKDIADHHTLSIERLESFFREELRQQCSGLHRYEKLARAPKLSTHKNSLCAEDEMSPDKPGTFAEVCSVPRAPSSSIPHPVVETHRDSTCDGGLVRIQRMKTRVSACESGHFHWMENMVSRITAKVEKQLSEDSSACRFDKRNCLQIPNTVMAKIANSDAFAFFFGAMVLLNAMFIGFRVQYGMTLYREDPRDPYPEWMIYVEQTFNAIFLFEMTFRILANRQVFFFRLSMALEHI